jgi:hypothetical protein
VGCTSRDPKGVFASGDDNGSVASGCGGSTFGEVFVVALGWGVANFAVYADGMARGWVDYRLMRHSDNYPEEVASWWGKGPVIIENGAGFRAVTLLKSRQQIGAPSCPYIVSPGCRHERSS